ncbi:MAG: GTP pyrophosphokinase family protein [Clostridia bacterium]|nr:GTP pyrophosphokinase family protein [Clostridia bacterium]MBQ9989165.1 GTP pyrophosphokinase family protein [Clostridia bacterium]
MEGSARLKQLVNDLQEGKKLEEIITQTEQFERLMSYYWCALQEVETKFRVLNNQLSIGGKRNPIESIKTRLKSVKSIEGKLERRQMEMTCEAIEKNLSDVAGIRVICSYVDDIYNLAESFLKQDDITLIKKKDYIAEPKPNGYRSLHLIIEIPVFLEQEKRMVRVEVQMRTIAMESWANLEHNTRYKKDIPEQTLKAVTDMLNECAYMSYQLDLKMQQARDIVQASNAAL